MAKRRHTRREITTKLEEADAMHLEGKLQSEIARTLGVSIMTYHRWRKGRRTSLARPPEAPRESSPSPETNRENQAVESQQERINEVQLENSRLRRLVIDLLLEKLKLEETLQERQASSLD